MNQLEFTVERLRLLLPRKTPVVFDLNDALVVYTRLLATAGAIIYENDDDAQPAAMAQNSPLEPLTVSALEIARKPLSAPASALPAVVQLPILKPI